jgi:hypothetical protein
MKYSMEELQATVKAKNKPADSKANIRPGLRIQRLRPGLRIQSAMDRRRRSARWNRITTLLLQTPQVLPGSETPDRTHHSHRVKKRKRKPADSSISEAVRLPNVGTNTSTIRQVDYRRASHMEGEE